MTPTLARMIAARQGQLSFPVKWFTVAQCFRYERMTRGRKREHYQWNMDIIGEESVSAEIEILAAAAAALRAMGMPDDAYRIRVNNRELLAELLAASGIAQDNHAAVFLALDKRGKISDDDIAVLLRAEGLGDDAINKTFELLSIETLDQAAALAGPDSPALAALHELFALAEVYGIADSGFRYLGDPRSGHYTGIVFEAFDTQRNPRDLRRRPLRQPAHHHRRRAHARRRIGFGDVVVVEVLKELLGETAAAEKHGVVIGYMFPEQREAATRLARSLREQGERVDLMLARLKPKQFFARAGASDAADAIFIGPDDVAAGSAKRKNLTTREETPITLI